jgi:hypothetical protein
MFVADYNSWVSWYCLINLNMFKLLPLFSYLRKFSELRELAWILLVKLLGKFRIAFVCLSFVFRLSFVLIVNCVQSVHLFLKSVTNCHSCDKNAHFSLKDDWKLESNFNSTGLTSFLRHWYIRILWSICTKKKKNCDIGYLIHTL